MPSSTVVSDFANWNSNFQEGVADPKSAATPSETKQPKIRAQNPVPQGQGPYKQSSLISHNLIFQAYHVKVT